MTYIYDDPSEFADDALEGFVDAYSHIVRRVDGGVVRRGRPATSKVAVIYGGGSGHYPAFAGVVGPGMGDGAVCGNIFTSPSTQQALNVARAAHSGAGVIYSYGNYAGDVMNFGLAVERLNAEGIQATSVIVTDDVASAPVTEIEKRRGIAGDFTVYKVMGAAAQEGYDFDGVVRVGEHANARTRSFGVAFAGCTFPGADAPLFTLPDGMMGVGLGIHGEPGLHDEPILRARDLGAMLVSRLLEEVPEGAGSRVAVILNGLGSTKQEELFVLWRTVAPLLREAGLEIVAPEIGEIVTSLDMAATSLTLMYLDDELERLWLAPALTPGFRRGDASIESATIEAVDDDVVTTGVAEGSEESRACAVRVVDLLTVLHQTVVDIEPELGRIDAIAGDGDHGRGMLKGATFALTAAQEALAQGAGAGTVLTTAGDAWAEKAGGTSGVLWGSGIRAMGETIGDQDAPSETTIIAAAEAYADRILQLGKAEIGDKTLVDALLPFVRSLRENEARGLPGAWRAAAGVATEAAEATKDLLPKKGRSRPLAEKSLGTPDPGAISLAAILTALGASFS